MKIKKSIIICTFLLIAIFLETLSVADTFDLLEMSEKLDQADKEDFLTAIDKANTCTRQHNFTCTDIQLTKASKLANGSRDQQTLLSVRESMVNEKNMMLKEQQRIAEEDRKAHAAQAERLRQQQAAADKSNDFQWGKAAALLGGSMIGGLDKLSSDVQAKVITGILKDSAGGQEGINNFTEVANSRSNTNKPTSSNYNNAIVQSQKQSATSNTVESSKSGRKPVIVADPNPYRDDLDWHDVGGSSTLTTRKGACDQARARADTHMDRLKTVENPSIVIAVSPCVCFDNFQAFGMIDDKTITCHVYIKTKGVKRSGPASGTAR